MLSNFLSVTAPDSLPITTAKRSGLRLPGRRRVCTLLAAAALSGVSLHVGVTIYQQPVHPRSWWSPIELVEHPSGFPYKYHHVAPPNLLLDEPPSAVVETVTRTETVAAPMRTDLQEALLQSQGTMRTGWRAGEDKGDMDVQQLRAMVDATKGYFSRDWSIGLGWNNLRYIIEAALLQSHLLNRTLVIPSFVYARSCEFEDDICSAYATLIDRQDAVGWDKWNGASLNSLAWHIPMEVMLDLPQLRRTHSVVLMSEYLELQGLPRSTEGLVGTWDRVGYHAGAFSPTLYVIRNEKYDYLGVLRVDRLAFPAFEERHAKSRVNAVLEEHIGGREAYEVEEVRHLLREARLGDSDLIETEEELERLLRQGGWGMAYTFTGMGGAEYTKTVVKPTKQVVPLSRCRGFVDEYGSIIADVILLEGETHLDRKPGQMRFMSEAARTEFARMVLYDLRPIEKVSIIADRIDARLRKMVGGRMWMSAHMRRGDFVTVGFENGLVEDHLKRIRTTLEIGRQTLLNLDGQQMFDVLDHKIETTRLNLPKPERGQWFYLATDERSPEGLQYLRENGALLIRDVLTIDDRRLVGWPLLLTDVLALVEQAVLARSSLFVGSSMSSLAGGVLNQRAARGMDPRTTIIG